MPEKILLKPIEEIPTDLIEEALGKPATERITAREPERQSRLGRWWKGITGAAAKEKQAHEEALAKAREAAKEQAAEREQARSAILSSQLKIGLVQGGQFVGFATAKVEPNPFRGDLPPFVSVTGMHFRGENPEVGARMLRWITVRAERIGAKHVGIAKTSPKLHAVLRHERERLRRGDIFGPMREISTDLVRGEPQDSIALKREQPKRKPRPR